MWPFVHVLSLGYLHATLAELSCLSGPLQKKFAVTATAVAPQKIKNNIII
jgi:hypothetical protein